MIKKKLCNNRNDWYELVRALVKDGEKIYYGELPDFPFIAVYEDRLSYKHVSFITMKDFEHK